MSEVQKNSANKAIDILRIYQDKAKKQEAALISLTSTMFEAIKPFFEKTEMISRQLQELFVQYKTAFTEGISNFEPPETYNSTETKIHPWAEELALREGFDLLEELPKKSFSFMLDRYSRGFEAYLREEYQLSTFTFISMIDGMIKRFCEMHKDFDGHYSKEYPNFGEGLRHLRSHYEMDIFVGKPEFECKLRAFFKHRNEIMHGGRYAYFDKNISMIALLFLTVTYSAVTSADHSNQ